MERPDTLCIPAPTQRHSVITKVEVKPTKAFPGETVKSILHSKSITPPSILRRCDSWRRRSLPAKAYGNGNSSTFPPASPLGEHAWQDIAMSASAVTKGPLSPPWPPRRREASSRFPPLNHSSRCTGCTLSIAVWYRTRRVPITARVRCVG